MVEHSTNYYEEMVVFGKEQRVEYNRFYDILERYGLKVCKRKRRISTTDSNHDLIPLSRGE